MKLAILFALTAVAAASFYGSGSSYSNSYNLHNYGTNYYFPSGSNQYNNIGRFGNNRFSQGLGGNSFFSQGLSSSRFFPALGGSNFYGPGYGSSLFSQGFGGSNFFRPGFGTSYHGNY